MKYREKIVQIEFLDDEERVIRRLQAVYNQSLKYITQKANALQEEIYKIQDKYNSIEDEQERETLKSMERSKVYQKQYQDALKAQVNSILDKMHRKEFKTVNKYLNDCYDKAFTGNMYVLHGEGIPLIVPIDQEKVVRAVQVNSKISKGLYSRLVVGTQSLMNMIQDAVNNSGNRDDGAIQALLEAIYNWMRNGGLYKLMIDVLTNGVELEFDNREIARLVKKYA